MKKLRASEGVFGVLGFVDDDVFDLFEARDEPPRRDVPARRAAGTVGTAFHFEQARSFCQASKYLNGLPSLSPSLP